MKTSEAGAKAIASEEGCRLAAYQDVAGVWTIGYGHTGPTVRDGLTVTQAEAEALLKLDLARFERAVTSAVRPTLHQHEFDALVSLAFNIGAAAFTGSTLVRMLNDSPPRWGLGRGPVHRLDESGWGTPTRPAETSHPRAITFRGVRVRALLTWRRKAPRDTLETYGTRKRHYARSHRPQR